MIYDEKRLQELRAKMLAEPREDFEENLKGGMSHPDGLIPLEGTSYAMIYNFLREMKFKFQKRAIILPEGREMAIDRLITLRRKYESRVIEAFGKTPYKDEIGNYYRMTYEIGPGINVKALGKIVRLDDTKTKVFQHTYINYESLFTRIFGIK